MTMTTIKPQLSSGCCFGVFRLVLTGWMFVCVCYASAEAEIHSNVERGKAPAISEYDFSLTVDGVKTNVWRSHLLVEAVIQVESMGNSSCVGRAGERGLMQIKRGTWDQMCRSVYGRSLPFNLAFAPELNRCVGSAYLAYLQVFLYRHRDRWMSDERSLLLACYNAGPQRVKSLGFNVKRLPFSVRDYVSRVSSLHDYYISKSKSLGDLALADH